MRRGRIAVWWYRRRAKAHHRYLKQKGVIVPYPRRPVRDQKKSHT